MLRHIRLLIFDLDYVVFDSAALKLQALRQSLVSFADAIPHSARLPDAADIEEAYREHGRRWIEFLDVGLGEASAPLAEAYRVHESRLIEAGAGRRFPTLLPLIDGWRRENLSLALGADAGRDYLLEISDREQLDSIFENELCTEEFGMGSVDEMLEEVMRVSEVNRSETIVLGTRPEYFRAARDLDVACVECGWGVHKQEPLSGADYRALTPAELTPILIRADEIASRYDKDENP